ncbi:3-octaprenyl-4-hydroxybenzoate carboxy-lyase [Candida albicans]
MSLNPALKFRDFIQVLKNEGDLVEIDTEVDPNLEVGAITRKAYENKLAAPLFNNLKQDPGNIDPKNLFRILGCPGGLRGFGNDHARIALHLGLDSQTPMKEIVDFLVANRNPKKFIPPVLVPNEKSPHKKHHLTHEQIDLTKLPVPLLHHGDGGKFIQTYGMWVLQTPDKSWTNWSIARGMVHDSKSITGLVINPQHVKQVSDAWVAAGKGDKIPFALCFGVPPAAILVSSMPIPDGATEAEYIGGLCNQAVPVVKCETNDLEVPADCEMVFEGYLDRDTLVNEGPFGEMHGYCFPQDHHTQPLYRVNHISYRDEAIMPISNPGLCTDETHTLIGGLVSAETKYLISQHPVLSKIVEDVFTPYEAQALWLAVKINIQELIKLQTNAKELSNLVGDFLFKSKECYKVCSILHEVILVGDDIDIFDFKQLIWAYTTRHTPVQDQVYFDDVKPFPLAPFISQGPLIKTRQGGKCVTSCIFPKQFTDPDFKFVTCNFNGYPEEVKNKVFQNWEKYYK